jgi:hypothetical protein
VTARALDEARAALDADRAWIGEVERGLAEAAAELRRRSAVL